MSNQETKPGDIVGTDSEYKRIENTLPEKHRNKDLSPITPLDTGNKKTLRTIGSFGVRKEKSIVDINSIGQKQQKELNDILLNNEAQQKSISTLQEIDNRKYKDGAEVSTSYDRAIKHKELEEDISRLASKVDANIDATSLHSQKQENNVNTPEAQRRKIELQLKNRSHTSKLEMNVFNNLDHNTKANVEVEDDNTRNIKQEVETSTPSSVKKQEVNTNIQDPGFTKQEDEITTNNPISQKTTKEYIPLVESKKQEQRIISNERLNKKQEIEKEMSISNPNKDEKSAFGSGVRQYKEWEQTIGDTYLPGLQNSEKPIQQTIGDVYFPDLQKSEKSIQYNTTNIEKESEKDFDPNRKLKSGIDGITAESTIDPLKVENISFIDTNLEYNNGKITTKSSIKQNNNLSYNNILQEFENSIKTDIEFSSNTLDQNDKAQQSESDHTTRSFTNTERPKKTQDPIYYQPDNINNRTSQDRSDLSEHTIEDGQKDINLNIDFSTRELGPTERDRKISDEFGEAQEPVIITELEDATIAYRPDRQDTDKEKIRGINWASIYSLARPIGLLKIQEKRLGLNSDLLSVAFNNALPLTNNFDNTNLTNAIKGSNAAISLTPRDNKQAGTNADDNTNIARHLAINAFRAVANNVLDTVFINGKINSSDKDQTLRAVNSPQLKNIADSAGQNIPAFTKGSIDENIRGEIKKDQFINALYPYSNQPISYSPAAKYKSYGDYINTLKIQIAGISDILSDKTKFDENELNEKLLSRYNQLNTSNAQENQLKIMIGQMIDFEKKLNENISKSNYLPYSSQSGIYSYSTSFSDQRTVFDIQNKNLKKYSNDNFNDPHISSALINETNVNGYDFSVTQRSAKKAFNDNISNISKKSRFFIEGSIKSNIKTLEGYGEINKTNVYYTDDTFTKDGKTYSLSDLIKVESSSQIKDIWAKYKAEYKQEDYSARDSSNSIFAWNWDKYKTIIESYSGINAHNIDNSISIEPSVYQEYYDVGDTEIKANINPLIKDAYFDEKIANDNEWYKYGPLPDLYTNYGSYNLNGHNTDNRNLNDFLADGTIQSYGIYDSIVKDIANTLNPAKGPGLNKNELEITDFSPRVDQKNITFNKEIFTTTNRHDIRQRDDIDKWKQDLKNKMENSIGRIIVNPNPYVPAPNGENRWLSSTHAKSDPSLEKTLFIIPLQFNPEITAESRQASWSSHTGYGRTNEFFIWTNTSSRQINLKTSYIVTSGPDVRDSSRPTKNIPKLENNPVYDTWLSQWTASYVHKTVEKYRSLVLPMDMSNPNLAVPPVIIIDFNGLFVRHTKKGAIHTYNEDGKEDANRTLFSRWVCEDISIDPIQELGYTASNFPRGFDISMTLKEIFHDWGDYQDIRTSVIDNIGNYNAQRG